MSNGRCISCNGMASGSYCSNCGERIERPQLLLRRYISNFLSEAVNLDAKFYRSFKLLLTKPGFLTQEYLLGRRKPYLRPIQMFLFANLMYFVIQPFTIYTGYNTTLQSQMRQQFYSRALGIEKIIKERIAREGVELQDFELRFNSKSSVYAKSLIFVMIPLFAIILMLFFAGSKKFFVEHLMFATHFFAWQVFYISTLFIFVYQFLFLGVRWLIQQGIVTFDSTTSDNMVFSLITWIFTEAPADVFILAYLFFATRRFYAQSKRAAFLKSFLLVFLFLPILFLYRLMLFWITYLTV